MFVFAVLAPGAVVMGTGAVLMARSAIRRDPPSALALRFFHVGLGLLYLIPGLGIVAATLLGWLLWPAAVGGLVTILLGVGVFYGVRISWPQRGS
jgi:hypothetical protein